MGCKSRKSFVRVGLGVGVSAMGGWGLTHPSPVQGLPPSEDLPEEVLRTEIITEARSPIDGTLLTAAEYAELQAKLRSTAAVKPDIAPQIQTRIILLRIRKIFRSIVPFIP